MEINISTFFFVLVCAATSFCTYIFLLRSNNLKITKKNDKGIRWASQSKPIMGGIGFFAAYVVGSLYYITFFDSRYYQSSVFITLVIGSVLGLITGLIDDTKISSPNFKFAMQILIGLVFIVTGNGIQSFDHEWLNYFFTVFWVVAFMNSINMLDNMDAISASVSAVALSMMIAVGVKGGTDVFIPLISAAVLLSLLTFLKWNWNPSKMYMGDNGSQFLGAFVAFVSIKTLWNNPAMTPSTLPLRELTVVVLAFIVPISDTTTVTINRLKAGKSPFVGGRDHTTHHLSYMGLNERKVALILISISLLFNAAAYYIIFSVDTFTIPQAILWMGAALLTFGGLYSTTIFAKQK